jgi:hypothetical protein
MGVFAIDVDASLPHAHNSIGAGHPAGLLS